MFSINKAELSYQKFTKKRKRFFSIICKSFSKYFKLFFDEKCGGPGLTERAMGGVL